MFYGQLGDAYNSLSDHAKSDQSYEAALVNDPNNDHVLNNYSYFLSLRADKLERAKKMSGTLVNKYPKNATYLDTYGWVLYVMGDYVEAEKYLKRAAQLENDGTIIEHYGDVLYKLGKEEEAMIHWKQAKELGGTSDLLDKKINEGTIYE
jgi:Tfp pilus assembly protein PilF